MLGRWIDPLRGARAGVGDGAFGDREVEVALHREAVRLHALKLGQRDVAPFVAIGAERRDAVAEEEEVRALRLAFGRVETCSGPPGRRTSR